MTGGTVRASAGGRPGGRMVTLPEIQYREWGDGPPVLALHGLGLESSSFTGLADGVVSLGMRMMAADLPGFGLTPAPEGAELTPPVLAAPVIELARTLDPKPIVMGMSLGARVALEAALLEPDLFRGVVMIAPPLPRRTHRWAHNFARLLSPSLAQRLPVDLAWPCLKRRAERLEDELTGDARHDWFVRSSKRTIYYISCPATRWAFVSAIRGLALDPAFGPDGVWTRLETLRIPAAFVWGDLDRFISVKDIPLVEERVPGAFQIRAACAGHFNNGLHFRCIEQGALEGIQLVDAVAKGKRRPATARTRTRLVSCGVDGDAPVAPGTDAVAGPLESAS